MRFTDEEKSNILQDQFSSVYTREPPGDIPRIEPKTKKYLSDVLVTTEMVKKELQSLDTSKSTGPDHIHPRLLKELAEHISNPITQLLNKTIKNQVIPTDWKMAFISPIFKKGSRNIASNYRPISLTCILCKLMEKFIRAKIMEHLQNKNLLSTKQFGFINGRSRYSYLIIWIDVRMS